ncbi:response regulator [Edaphobacter bradus]|uniref:response regulator n=1 Tax=Edaphobacter bradus TaxID=2259016 RepID=UPI0021DFB8EC|nr:response regulator transcription factor [Edaphobacter bradus]
MKANRTIRILLIDDHTLFRESLRRLLEAVDAFEIAGDVSSTSDVLNQLSRMQVDMILLDFDLGEKTALDFLAQVHSRNLKVHILLVTAGLNQPDIVRVFELGISGIFLKHSPPEDLVTAIHRVMNGEAWLDPRLMGSMVANITSTSLQKDSSRTLNDRQREVLQGVFEGLSNKEIAAKLDISEPYVKAILQQLFNKTGVRSRSQLVRVALENPTLYGIARG